MITISSSENWKIGMGNIKRQKKGGIGLLFVEIGKFLYGIVVYMPHAVNLDYLNVLCFITVNVLNLQKKMYALIS